MKKLLKTTTLFLLLVFTNAGFLYAQQEALRIDAVGNVGIGIAPSSSFKLNVGGHINIGGSLNANTGAFSGSLTAIGNVGIGISNPSSKLHLYDGSANNYLTITAPFANQSSISFGDITNGQDIVTYRPGNSRDYRIWTTGAGDVVSVTQAGNVGIGTINPSLLIDTKADATIGTSSVTTSQHDPSNRGTKISIGAASPEFAGMKVIVAAGTAGCGNTSDVLFNTWECNTSISREVMRINGSGNVGIGISNPAATLEVKGTFMERMDLIITNNRGDWTAQNHPVMIYFKNKLRGKPVGTYIKAIADNTGWKGHYWQGWVDMDGKIRVIHNYHNTGAVVQD